MAKAVALIALLVMIWCLHLSEAVYDESALIHIGGKVMCQDCTQSWNEWVNGAKPIKGVKVSVTCLDDRRHALYYGSDETDEGGEYNMAFEKSVYGKELDPSDCLVRLVSSPDPECNVATDFGHGKSGVRLHQPNVRYRDTVKYLLGTFYYTSSECDDSDSSDD